MADPFETHTEAYDEWYDDHDRTYLQELAAIETALEDVPSERALEVGVGTGRFAGPLGFSVGIDPANNTLERADERGVEPVRGVGETLPFADGSFDLVVFVATWCFLEDIDRTLAETRRVLDPAGSVVVGFLDRSSPLGETYRANKSESPFYADARLQSATEVCDRLEAAGFSLQERFQTVFDAPGELPDDDSEASVREGHGDGLFGVVRGSIETAFQEDK